MVWLYYFILLCISVLGLLLNILGLPGLWLILLSVIGYGWLTGWLYVGVPTIATLFILAIIAEIFEFFAGAVGTKKAGGTRLGMSGAVVGGFVGGLAGSIVIPIPVIGTIIGAVAGSFAGAAGVERLVEPDTIRALKIGSGAAIGRLAGIAIKSGFGMAMLFLTMILALPVGGSTPKIAAPTTLPPASSPT